MTQDVGRSREDYLSAIARTRAEKGYCLSVDIATALHISKPSVSVMIRNLENEGYVTRDGNELGLTERGRAIAEGILHRHQLLSRLFQLMGVPQPIAERDAGDAEHDISDETYEKLDAMLAGSCASEIG